MFLQGSALFSFGDCVPLVIFEILIIFIDFLCIGCHLPFIQNPSAEKNQSEQKINKD